MANEMKEMVYGGDSSTDILYYGTYGEFDIAILRIRGTHPCAYIRVPDRIIKKLTDDGVPSTVLDDYDMWWAGSGVHGGFTFLETFGTPSTKPKNFEIMRFGFWLGWDYAHADDYVAIMMADGTILNLDRSGKMWTTSEILKEAQDICDTLELDIGDKLILINKEV